MEQNFIKIDEEINKFYLPRWRELPTIDLYLDQLVCLLEQYLSNYIQNDSEKEEKLITKTMINNYVKHHIIKPPINKKYNKEHIAYLFVVFILKQVYSINDIKRLIQLAIQFSSPQQVYDLFCEELEQAIKLTFNGQTDIIQKQSSPELYMLKNVVQSFAKKLYVLKVYLNN